MQAPSIAFPDGRRFAFTIIDDTDVATTANVEPMYQLLYELGMRTTKTVWMLPWAEGRSDFDGSATLADTDYREFCLGLQRRGFEIASHGARMESSQRDVTVAAMALFRETFGAPARVYANHAYNRENVYWGVDRVDNRLIKAVYSLFNGRPRNWYQGHQPGTEFWWGDMCQSHHVYVRNLTFEDVNLLRINPSMPYRDPTRPLVHRWFSACDANDRTAFNRLLRPSAQERLEREGGVCLVATHFGKGFVTDASPHPETARLLRLLASRDGWFPPVGELLDYLAARRGSDLLPPLEWRRMQWRWLLDLFRARLRIGRRSRRAQPGPSDRVGPIDGGA
jgi:hypothetical protein